MKAQYEMDDMSQVKLVDESENDSELELGSQHFKYNNNLNTESCYQRNPKALHFICGFGGGAILVALIFAVSLRHNDHHDEGFESCEPGADRVPYHDFSWKKQKVVDLQVGPVLIMQGSDNDFWIPLSMEERNAIIPGDELIKKVEFKIVDIAGTTVPLEHIYNHHAFIISFRNEEPIAAFGAESRL